MLSRRRFLQHAALGTAGALVLPTLGAPTAWASSPVAAGRLVILHTNDVHSRLEPFPNDGSRFAGLGGAARRAALVERIRAEEEHVLLLDSGDIFQGTPYFNLFGGKADFEVMSAMRYDFATLGNHDFDNGVGGLVEMLPYAEFGFLSANYDVAGSALAGHVEPFAVRQVGPMRVGIFGLGIAFERLVLPELHEGVTYRDAVGVARETVRELRGAQGCDLVVCLSHLGYQYTGEDRVDDLTVADSVPGLDLILGGHTHTFLDEPTVVQHQNARPTVVHQAGWAGIRLGRVDVPFGPTGEALSVAGGHYDLVA
jgi:5'-nucleotidase